MLILLPALPLLLPLQSATGEDDPARAADAFSLAEGMEIELFAAEPWLENPVALSVDGRGRVHVVETHRYLNSVFDVVTYQPEWLPADLGLRTVADRRQFLLETVEEPTVLTADTEVVRRLVDLDGDGRVDASAELLRGFQRAECGPVAGLLARNDGVWVGCVPDLVRIHPGGRSERLHTGFGVHVGVSGHDLHGLRLGPDGRLYFSMGDRGAHIELPDGGIIDLPDTGAVFRCELDGSGLEVVAIGLRNPQELAFDHLGNLFTADNDTAGADRSRVVHVVPGGDYGWRCSYQHMPGFGPWVQEELWRGGRSGALPHAGYVPQGPSGLTYDVGTGLGARWRNCFLVCDFPGGILAFRTEAEGASYRTTEGERLLWNLWPTDADFGPDGSLYVSDWVAGWQQPHKGRIWRVSDGLADEGDLAFGRDAAELLAADLDLLPVEDRIDMLGHPDRRVRQEAHLSLAGSGAAAVPALTRLLLDGAAPSRPRLHATWSLAILLRRGKSVTEAEEALVMATEDSDPDVRCVARRAAGELRLTGARGRLLAGLGDPDSRAAFEATLALARLGGRDPLGWMGRPLPPVEQLPVRPEQVQADLLPFLHQRGDDPYLAHAASLALLAWYPDEDLARLARAGSPAVRSAALQALRRARSPRIADFLSGDTLREAAHAIHDEPVIEARDALCALDAAALAADGEVEAARRVLAARYQRGLDEDARELARVALEAPVTERAGSPEVGVLALSLLGSWGGADPLDPVTGLWNPTGARDVSPAREAIEAVATKLLAGPRATEALASFQALGAGAVAGSLLEVVENSGRPAGLRAACLEAWKELTGSAVPEELAARLMLAPEPELQQVALASMPEGTVLVQQLVELVAAANTEPELAATALARLTQATPEAAAPVLVEQLERLREEGSHPIAIELLETAEELDLGAVVSARSRLMARWNADGELGPYRVALAGGDRRLGERVFREKTTVECLRCHSVARPGDDEGKVGPALADVGKRLTPMELLQSVVQPNAVIAAGYESAVVALDDGTIETGIVVRDDEQELVLRDPQGEEIVLEKSWIESRGVGLSAMPQGHGEKLTRRELRDLMAYLRSLDGGQGGEQGH